MADDGGADVIFKYILNRKENILEKKCLKQLMMELMQYSN